MPGAQPRSRSTTSNRLLQDGFRSAFDNNDGGSSSHRSLTFRTDTAPGRADPRSPRRTNPRPACTAYRPDELRDHEKRERSDCKARRRTNDPRCDPGPGRRANPIGRAPSEPNQPGRRANPIGRAPSEPNRPGRRANPIATEPTKGVCVSVPGTSRHAAARHPGRWRRESGCNEGRRTGHLHRNPTPDAPTEPNDRQAQRSRPAAPTEATVVGVVPILPEDAMRGASRCALRSKPISQRPTEATILRIRPILPDGGVAGRRVERVTHPSGASRSCAGRTQASSARTNSIRPPRENGGCGVRAQEWERWTVCWTMPPRV
jgi:hypothetical protein